MRDTARVLQIHNDEVLILPLLSDTCIGCSGNGCPKLGRPFVVSNKKKLSLEVGSVVKIASSSASVTLQALIALVFPVAAAVLGYVLAEPFAQKVLGIAIVGESYRIAGVLVCFLVAALLVLLMGKSSLLFKKAFVSEVLSR